jgi:hypothetical protein
MSTKTLSQLAIEFAEACDNNSTISGVLDVVEKRLEEFIETRAFGNPEFAFRRYLRKVSEQYRVPYPQDLSDKFCGFIK